MAVKKQPDAISDEVRTEERAKPSKKVSDVNEKGLELAKKLLDNALAANSLNDNQINNVKLAIDLYNTFKG